MTTAILQDDPRWVIDKEPIARELFSEPVVEGDEATSRPVVSANVPAPSIPAPTVTELPSEPVPIEDLPAPKLEGELPSEELPHQEFFELQAKEDFEWMENPEDSDNWYGAHDENWIDTAKHWMGQSPFGFLRVATNAVGLTDTNPELLKEALGKYAALPDERKHSPEGRRYAAMLEGRLQSLLHPEDMEMQNFITDSFMSVVDDPGSALEGLAKSIVDDPLGWVLILASQIPLVRGARTVGLLIDKLSKAGKIGAKAASIVKAGTKVSMVAAHEAMLAGIYTPIVNKTAGRPALYNIENMMAVSALLGGGIYSTGLLTKGTLNHFGIKTGLSEQELLARSLEADVIPYLKDAVDILKDPKFEGTPVDALDKVNFTDAVTGSLDKRGKKIKGGGKEDQPPLLKIDDEGLDTLLDAPAGSSFRMPELAANWKVVLDKIKTTEGSGIIAYNRDARTVTLDKEQLLREFAEARRRYTTPNKKSAFGRAYDQAAADLNLDMKKFANFYKNPKDLLHFALLKEKEYIKNQKQIPHGLKKDSSTKALRHTRNVQRHATSLSKALEQTGYKQEGLRKPPRLKLTKDIVKATVARSMQRFDESLVKGATVGAHLGKRAIDTGRKAAVKKQDTIRNEKIDDLSESYLDDIIGQYKRGEITKAEADQMSQDMGVAAARARVTGEITPELYDRSLSTKARETASVVGAGAKAGVGQLARDLKQRAGFTPTTRAKQDEAIGALDEVDEILAKADAEGWTPDRKAAAVRAAQKREPTAEAAEAAEAVQRPTAEAVQRPTAEAVQRPTAEAAQKREPTAEAVQRPTAEAVQRPADERAEITAARIKSSREQAEGTTEDVVYAAPGKGEHLPIRPTRKMGEILGEIIRNPEQGFRKLFQGRRPEFSLAFIDESGKRVDIIDRWVGDIGVLTRRVVGYREDLLRKFPSSDKRNAIGYRREKTLDEYNLLRETEGLEPIVYTKKENEFLDKMDRDFDRIYDWMKLNGMFEGEGKVRSHRRNNFFPHFYDDPLFTRFEDYLQQLQSGAKTAVSLKSTHAYERQFKTMLEAKQAGFNPVEDAARVMELYLRGIYHIQMNKMLVTDARKLRLPDGTRLYMDRDAAPENYVEIRHPAFVDKSGQYMKAHPDVVADTKMIFDTSNPGMLRRLLLNLAYTSKRTLLAFSFFHGQALLESAIYAGVAPWKMVKQYKSMLNKLHKGELGDEIDHYLRNGLLVGGIDDMKGDAFYNLMAAASSTIDKIVPNKGVAKILKMLPDGTRIFHEKLDKILWDKIATGGKLVVMNRAYTSLVRKDVARAQRTGEPLTDSNILAQRAASYTNDAFGGLNWVQLARGVENEIGEKLAKAAASKGGRQAMQLMMFAPDWTLANIRIIGKAIPGLTKDKDMAMLHRYYAMRGAAIFALGGEAIQQATTQTSLFDNEFPFGWMRPKLGDGYIMEFSKQLMEVPRELIRLPYDPLHPLYWKSGVYFKGIADVMNGKPVPDVLAKSFTPITISVLGEQGPGTALAGALGKPIYDTMSWSRN